MYRPLSFYIAPLLRSPLTSAEIARLLAAVDRIGKHIVSHQATCPRRGAFEPPCNVCETRQEALAMLHTLTLVSPEPALRVGTLVRYHGSLADKHGEYIYQGLCGCDDHDDFYDPDCDDRHQLACADGRASGIFHVRRRSFTPLAP